MPELPDLEAYCAALRPRLIGRELRGLRLGNPFVLRSVEPPPGALVGKRWVRLERLAKRIVMGFEEEHYLVCHLMLAGRFHWKRAGASLGARSSLAALDLADGSLFLTEAGTKRRASLHILRGRAALAAHDPGGIEPLSASLVDFEAALRRENRTLKRALTDPRILAGIGNAYSDEILFHARLSPFQRTRELAREELERLHVSTQAVLGEWCARLIAEARTAFPEKVTAFRAEMAVHGRARSPCRTCGAPIQRVVHGERELCYCPGCQTGGRILADRALSRLLHEDWPRRLEDLE